MANKAAVLGAQISYGLTKSLDEQEVKYVKRLLDRMENSDLAEAILGSAADGDQQVPSEGDGAG
jgi:hypothetical protein